MARISLSRPADAYGLAGLIPFVALAALVWLLPPSRAALALFALLAYGAVILSFLGAVQWGLALAASDARSGRGDAAGWRRLGWAVTPALLGWAALLLPPAPGLALLILGFAAAWVADRGARDAGLLPDWFLPLRSLLTAVVLAALAAALAWLFVALPGMTA